MVLSRRKAMKTNCRILSEQMSSISYDRSYRMDQMQMAMERTESMKSGTKQTDQEGWLRPPSSLSHVISSNRKSMVSVRNVISIDLNWMNVSRSNLQITLLWVDLILYYVYSAILREYYLRWDKRIQNTVPTTMPTRAVSFQIQSGANMIQYEHFMTSSRRNEKRNVNILRHIQTKKRLKDKTKSMNIETFIKPRF